MFSNAYIEITNVCNLSCSFCHGTKRAPRTMSEEEFQRALSQVAPWAKTVFFHLLGEPLLHPLLPSFIKKVKALGINPVLTTNGTLLSKKGAEVIESDPYKVNISLHSFEANKMGIPFEEYVNNVLDFAQNAASKGIFVILRLWNDGGLDKLNDPIIQKCRERFSDEWVLNPRTKGSLSYRIADRIFIEWDSKFEWPDTSAPKYEGDCYCHGLKMQIGILSDGSVVPCCLDSEGDITLGNIFSENLEDILSSPRALGILDGFKQRKAIEELCLRCEYRTRFSKT